MPIRVQVGSRIVEFPDGTPESEMLAALQSIPAEDLTPASTSSWTDSLPMVGGMAASMLGGSKASPIGMALAGVGGAAGEAYRQVADSVRGDFSDVPDSIGGRLARIGTEGLKQAGFEGGGRLVGAALRPIAKTIYGLALRPAKALARDAGGGKLLQGANRIIDQGLADNVMPSGAGVTRAMNKVKESAQEATAIAGRSQTPISIERVLQKAVDDQSGRAARDYATAGVATSRDAIKKQVGRVVESHTTKRPAEAAIQNVRRSSGGASPVFSVPAAPAAEMPMVSAAQLLNIRRGAEDIAAPIFKAAKMPGGAGRVAPGSEASVSRSISGAVKQTLDDVLGQPFRDVNARTQARMALKQAVDDASARPNMLTNLLAGGVGVGSAASSGDAADALEKAALMRLLFSPTAQGALAIGLNRAPYANLYRAGKVLQDQE